MAPAPEREMWVLIGRIEERTRCGRVVADWKRFAATQKPDDFDTQALLSQVVLEIIYATEELGK